MNKFLKGMTVMAILCLAMNYIDERFDQKSIDLMKSEIDQKNDLIENLKLQVKERDAEIIRLNALPK